MTDFRSTLRGRDPSLDIILPAPTPSRGAAVLRRRYDIVDAEFVVLPKSAQAWERRGRNDNRRPAAPLGHTVSPWLRKTFGIAAAALRPAERFLQWLPLRGFAALVVFAFLAVFGFAGGVSALQAALTAGDAPAFAILDVARRVEDRNGMKVLAVYGTVENGTAQSRVTPDIAVDIITSGRVTTQRVKTFDTPLPAGGRESFVLRVPYSGAKAPEVAVSFEGAGAPAE